MFTFLNAETYFYGTYQDGEFIPRGFGTGMYKVLDNDDAESDSDDQKDESESDSESSDTW